MTSHFYLRPSSVSITAMEKMFEEYAILANRNEDLKSAERVLNTALENSKAIKSLLIEKEKEFCNNDQELRASARGRNTVKDSLRKRCFGLIDHLVHYKCVIECLSSDLLNMESNLISDDEYIHLSLIFREAESDIRQAIKRNQQRNEIFLSMHDEVAQSYLAEIEPKWRFEHKERRKQISKLILDQNQVIKEKITNNLEQQQALLNQRYQSINNLIKLSYINQHCDDNNNTTCSSSTDQWYYCNQ